MKIIINNPETFGAFSFPCGDDALENLMKEHYPQALETRTIPVHEFISPKEFSFLNDQEIDLDELNFLAKLNDRFDQREESQYFALMQIKHPASVKDLINLSEYNDLGEYALIRDVSDPKKVGEQHYLYTHGIMEPDQFTKEELYEMGRNLLQSGKGIVTEYGILFPNEEQLCANEPEEPFYNGKTFPEYYYDSYLAGISIHYGDAVEYLYFPDDETAIARALRRVGTDSFDDCGWEIETLDSGSPKLDQYLEEILRDEGVYAFSRACRAIRDLERPDTLAHIIEYTGRTDSESIIALAENMDLFYVTPEVWDDECLVCDWMDDHDYTCSLEVWGYVDKSAFAKGIKEMTRGKILEDGCFVGVTAPEDFDELFQTEQEDNLTMGGLS